MGGIYEGRDLGWALRSHVASFTKRHRRARRNDADGSRAAPFDRGQGSALLDSPHALTNAYRHAEAGRVSVQLEFGEEETRLSVSDDGTGLPDDYAERGPRLREHEQRRRASGRASRRGEEGATGGATVTCVIPRERG